MLLRLIIGGAGGLLALLTPAFAWGFWGLDRSFASATMVLGLIALVICIVLAVRAPTPRTAGGQTMIWLGELLVLTALGSPLRWFLVPTVQPDSGLVHGSAAFVFTTMLMALIVLLPAALLLYLGKWLVRDPRLIPGWLRPLVRS